MGKPNIIKFEEIITSIKTERDYQDKVWGDSGIGSKDESRQISSYILWMEHYLLEARTLASTSDEINNKEPIMDLIRKVSALGVACGQEHGMPKRK